MSAVFDAFPMPFTETFTISRPRETADPYNPDTTVTDWSQPTTFTVNGFMASQTSAEQAGEPGQERLVTRRVLTVPDPDAGIQRGDRVTGPDGRTFEVEGYTARDMNPFTGWRPTLVCQLRETTG